MHISNYLVLKIESLLSALVSIKTIKMAVRTARSMGTASLEDRENEERGGPFRN